MKRFALFGLAALAVVGALAGTASASPPIHTTTPFAGTFSAPAGSLCDFGYFQVFSGTDDLTIFSDGRVELHEKVQVSHTNTDTGVTLTETDRFNATIYMDGSAKQIGIFWHLRDASGKLVLVHAGQVVFDSLGNVVRITPNVGGDQFAAVICPALGGNPA